MGVSERKKCARTHTYGEAFGDEKMPLKRQWCQHLSKVRKIAPVPQDYINNQFLEEQ